MTSNNGEMSFLDHLEELRWRIIKAVVAVVVCAIPCGLLWRRIFELVMIYPLRFSEPRPEIVAYTPPEAIILSIKIAVAGGFILASPIVFYQLWRFIAPGLYKNEKTVVLPTVVASTFSFLAGVAFSYVVLPHAMKFLAGYGSGALKPMYRANDYIGFIVRIVLAFGLVFELPVLSFVLTKMGLLAPKFLVDKFRYALLAMFVLAAVLTPPDVVSQVFLVMPLIVLYGISILVSHLARRKAE